MIRNLLLSLCAAYLVAGAHAQAIFSLVPPLSSGGGTMTGDIVMGGNDITNAGSVSFLDSGFALTLDVATLTANRAVTFADAPGTVVLSTLATNAPNAANSVWLASNSIVFEGATADAFELTQTVTTLTAARTITWADLGGVPIVSAGLPEEANAIWVNSSGQIVAEGSANVAETFLSFENPSFDAVPTIPAHTGYLPLVLFTQTANAGPSATDAETAITGTGVGTLSVPANSWRVGRTLRFRAKGYIATTGTPALQVRAKLGTTTVVDSGNQTLVAISGNGYFEVDGEITCRTTGASGTMIGQMRVTYFSGATTANSFSTASTATTTVATDQTHAFSITFDFDAANSATCTNFALVIEN